MVITVVAPTKPLKLMKTTRKIRVHCQENFNFRHIVSKFEIIQILKMFLIKNVQTKKNKKKNKSKKHFQRFTNFKFAKVVNFRHQNKKTT